MTLGDLRLESPDGGELLSGRRKELALLAFLARRSPRAVTREELAALLWGERETAKARQSLRHVLLQLRRALGAAIDVTPDRAQVDAALVELDAAALERDLADGRIWQAVVRWRGDFLAGAEDVGGESFRAWVEAEREGLRRRVASALDRLIEDALGRGQWAEGVAWAEQWAEALPLDEEAHRRLLEALKAAGRPDEALAVHATFAARLREELSREPSPAFKALANDLARAGRQPRTSGPGSTALLTPDMVGREAVLADLVAAWYEARAGHSTAVVVAGDEGLGKTRLCQELVRRVKADDTEACVLAGRGYEGERDVMWSTARRLLTGLADAPGLLGAAPSALRAVARIVPAVGRQRPGGAHEDTPPAGADRAETTAEMAAVCEVLEAVASELPVLLVLDDAPFADAATQRTLAALLRRSPPGVMLVMTGQPDALSASLLAEELRQNRSVRRLQLQTLGATETEALVDSMVALVPDDRRRLATRLHSESEGNPFYTTELVFALAEDGALALGPDGRWRVDTALVERRFPLPSGVRETVRRRLAALSDDERLCLQVAAINGRRIDPALLERATGLAPDRLTAALDRLLARRLLRETASDPGRATAYEFAHEMVRRVAHDLATAARVPEESRPRSIRVGRRRVALLAAFIVLATTVVALAARLTKDASSSSDRPAIAIVAMGVAGGDTAAAWLADGLPQMIAAKLARSTDVEVIPPPRTRALRLRAGHGERDMLSVAQILDVARRLRATIAVSGELTRGDTALVLSLAAHDVATGRLLHSDALSRADVLALADEAAARLLNAAGAEGPGLRLADLETSSVAAYQHFVRANRLAFEGYHGESARELDAAVALDSGFVGAVQARLLAALAANSYDDAERLARTLERYGTRATGYDRLLWATFQAARQGEIERSEALARTLVRRRPRDPRAHVLLIDIYGMHGRWDAAEAATREALALDSLGMEAGKGSCVPCLGYGRLVALRLVRGDWLGAEQAARRWIALQPELPGAWRALATTLAYMRRYDEALAAMRRSVALCGGDPPMLDQLARMLVLARRLEEADSLVAAWLAGAHPGLRRTALDLRVMLDRERGQLRASNRNIDRAIAADSGLAFLELIRGNTLGRLGDYAAAERVYERNAHGSDLRTPLSLPLDPVDARGFCWAHALLADAVAPTGDTLRLKAIADTLERGCARSYYGRDWILHYHVRGLVHAAAGRHMEAAREFRRAQWVVADGWSRTTLELAKAQLALGWEREAIATLRAAYATPLDAMGRYVPRSELDYQMALAFHAAGMLDSAAVYAAHVSRTWKDADPEVRRLLASLPR